MSYWRFRTNLLGKLILQRGYNDYDHPFLLWRDATTEDLQDYYSKFNQK